MRNRSTRIFVVTVLLCMVAGQCAAFDLQIGRIDVNPPSAAAAAPRPAGKSAIGAVLTIPFGDCGSIKSAPTVNGMVATRFTRQNAKDAAISLMLIGTFIAVGVLTVGAAANSISSE